MLKYSLTISGHRTSISLEPEYWQAFNDIAQEKGRSVSGLATDLDRTRTSNLSSTVRLFVLDHYRQLAKAHPVRS